MSNAAARESRIHPSLFWRLWLRSISVKRPQAALAIGSLAIGAAIVSALLNLYGDADRKMRQEFRAYGPNVVVSSAALPAENPRAGLIDESVVNHLSIILRANKSDLVAVPVLYVVTRIRSISGGRAQDAVAAGADFIALHALYSGWRVESDGADRGPEACVLGARLASRLGAGVGDAIELGIDGQPANGWMNERSLFRIAGIVRTGAAEDDQIFVPLPLLQQAARLAGRISLVQLSEPGGARDVERDVRTLSQALPGLDVRPVRQIVHSEGRVLGTIRWLLGSLAVLILVITALCVMATMTAIVLERSKDIAVMKALGATSNAIARLFMAEGAALGLTGGSVGFIFGGLLARHLARQLFSVALTPVWWAFPAVVALVAALAIIATMFPVRIVRDVQPASVLKGE